MTVKLSYAQAKHDLLELARDNPDYRYQPPNARGSCVYFADDGAPSCIVGHVISKHGVERDDLRQGAGDLNSGTGPATLTYREVIKFDAKTNLLLTRVQQFQDCGDRWDEAVHDAIKLVEAEKW